MQRCEFCGAELPSHARFCGNCGLGVSNGAETLTATSDGAVVTWISPDTPPLSSSGHPFVGDRTAGQAGEDITFQTNWPGMGVMEYEQVPEENQTIGLDLLLPGMIQGNVPGFGGDIPMVQGTPQASSVPTVPETPPGLSTPPQHMPNPQTPPHLAARTSFPRDVHTPPPNHTAGMQSPHSPQAPQPIHSPQPPYRNEPAPHDHSHEHQHTGRVHEHREEHTHHVRGQSTTSKLVAGRRRLMHGASARWLIVVVAAVVVVVTGGIFAVIAFNPSPTLLLSGSSSVSPGGVLSLHGSGFSPGAGVSLTLDHGLPLSFVSGSPAKEDQNRAARGASLATASLLLSGGYIEQSSSPSVPGTTIRASSGGTFDIQIVVQQGWSAGQHTIQAKETNSSRSAALTFTVVSRPARLSVNPLSLDFGSLQVNSKVYQSIVIANAGEGRLTWTADTGGARWLKVLGSAGAIEPGGPQEFVYVMADTSQLSVGNYTATLTINSNGGKEQVGVKLSVIASAVKQAKLSVNPPMLDFGKVSVGQQATMALTVSNVGTQPLNWQVDTRGTSWLTLDPNTGKVDVGQQPEMIHVTVDTTKLGLGNQSATLSFNSNGGSAQVTVTLEVTTAAKPPAPILTGTPNNFSVPGDSNCTYDANSGWTCVASLSSYKTAQGNLNWTASSIGVGGVNFSPSSGTLTPGQTAKVSISIPNTACPTNADFIFTGPGNSVDLPWSCAAITLAASPNAFDANTDCTFNNGWTCFATLNSGSNAQGYLNWSTSASGISGISFSLSSGSLAPGQKQQVTISIPNTACPASASFNFAGATNSVTVPWKCSPVSLQISRAHMDGSDCTYDSTNGWACTEALSLSSNNPGDPSLSWSTSSSGIDKINFSPANSVLSSGQTTPVTITIPNTNCPAQATFTFTSPSNTVNATWNCAAPHLSASPGSFTANSDCTLGTNSTWSCTATVSSDPNAQGNLSWSASGSGVSGITFSPQNGMLSPGQSRTVTIGVPTTCPASATLGFTGPANTVSIPWKCNPPTLAVSQTNFNIPDGNCAYSAGQGWTCTTMLTNQDSQQSLSWSATSSGINGITVTSSSYTLSPGQTSTVTIVVPDTTCPASATITFTGPANSVNVTWSCPAPTLTISPTGVSNCPQNSDGSWTCTVMLALAQGSQGNLGWSASSSLSGVSFNPAGGTLLSSNPSVSVAITIPSTDCTNGTFTFAGQGQGANAVTASWSCTPPSVAGAVKSGSFSAGNYSNGLADVTMWSEGRQRLGLAA